MADNLLEAIRYTRGKLELLDQRLLPHESVYIDISDSEAAWLAIRDMVVRGAPAIAISAALALAVEAVRTGSAYETPDGARDFISHKLQYLVSSRPTAVNLGIAATELQKVVVDAAANGSTAEGVITAYVEAAESMLADDVASNKAIGSYGAEAIWESATEEKRDRGLRVLTHCNTGSLATAAYGTALGVIRKLFSDGKLLEAFCTETRPYNQGSRLTAFELVHDGIPATLIADSAAAFLQSSNRVDAIVVGADRIAANGDTANKIGTYSLALSAHHHGIPFFVAAPLTSVDVSMAAGTEIVIEERSPKELTHALGGQGVQVAPTGIRVWNPAFDVTPAALISGIITDKGVIRKLGAKSEFDIPAFIAGLMGSQSDASNPSIDHVLLPKLAGKSDLDVRGFYPLSESKVVDYILSKQLLVDRLGSDSTLWKVQEVGDGNLNFVYIVQGPSGSIVLKQALPYIRCVGESWPMTLERATFESLVLREHGRLVPHRTPAVFLFDHGMAAIAMEYLPSPLIILRKGLIAGTVYPLLAEHISEYIAHTLFHTSLIAISTLEHKKRVERYCGNVEMCRLTEQVIFTDPYRVSEFNRWTSPQLDEDARAVREDVQLKVIIASLKAKFCEKTQSLIHGDLHTGSVMVTPASTYVIDPEFGFYGPMGFDLGGFVGNLVLAYFSQQGHEKAPGDRSEYKKWIAGTIVQVWELFEARFRGLWDQGAKGDAYPVEVYDTVEALRAAQDEFLEEVFFDMQGFMAAKIIRRIVGIAHVEDMESIPDADLRATCERKALNFAKKVLKGIRPKRFPTINSLVDEVINSDV